MKFHRLHGLNALFLCFLCLHPANLRAQQTQQAPAQAKPAQNPFETVPQSQQPAPANLRRLSHTNPFERPPQATEAPPPADSDVIAEIEFRGSRRVPQDTCGPDLHSEGRQVQRRSASSRFHGALEHRAVSTNPSRKGTRHERLDHPLRADGAARGSHHQVRRHEVGHRIRNSRSLQGTQSRPRRWNRSTIPTRCSAPPTY